MTRTTPEADAAARPGFDPERFFKLASQVGHGRAIGMEYRGHGEDWVELSLPWREQLVGVPESGILASGAMAWYISRSYLRVVSTRPKMRCKSVRLTSSSY